MEIRRRPRPSRIPDITPETPIRRRAHPDTWEVLVSAAEIEEALLVMPPRLAIHHPAIRARPLLIKGRLPTWSLLSPKVLTTLATTPTSLTETDEAQIPPPSVP